MSEPIIEDEDMVTFDDREPYAELFKFVMLVET